VESVEADVTVDNDLAVEVSVSDFVPADDTVDDSAVEVSAVDSVAADDTVDDLA
jgi:hypothetical protein